MKFKRKQLNNKGFTLVELLAVVVILALLVGISIPSVLTAMNNSRVSTLHSNAVSFANWYTETVAQDELLPEAEKIIQVSTVQTISNTGTNWQCLGTIEAKSGTTLAEAYDLSADNFILTGTAPTTADPAITTGTCSAIRTNESGKVEVLLVAKSTGRYNVAKYAVTFAISSEDNGCISGTNKCAAPTS